MAGETRRNKLIKVGCTSLCSQAGHVRPELRPEQAGAVGEQQDKSKNEIRITHAQSECQMPGMTMEEAGMRGRSAIRGRMGRLDT